MKNEQAHITNWHIPNSSKNKNVLPYPIKLPITLLYMQQNIMHTSNQIEASTQPDIYTQKENRQLKMKIYKIFI